MKKIKTIIISLLDQLKKWWKNRAIKKNSLLNAESAYTLSAIRKDTTLEVLYQGYKRTVLKLIEDSARYNNTELYLVYPDYIIAGHKEELIHDLIELGYTVPYISKKSIIINWETE